MVDQKRVQELIDSIKVLLTEDYQDLMVQNVFVHRSQISISVLDEEKPTDEIEFKRSEWL